MIAAVRALSIDRGDDTLGLGDEGGVLGLGLVGDWLCVLKRRIATGEDMHWVPASCWEMQVSEK